MVTAKVDSEFDKIIKAVTTAGILGGLTAAVRALIVSNEKPMQKVRTFFAGVFISLFLGYVLMHTEMSEFYKSLIIGGSSAFISTVWPTLERLAKKYVSKKGGEVVSDSDNTEHRG
jgi:uncharacterized membrane protein